MPRIACTIVLAAAVAAAQEPTLKAGSDAPALSIAKWVKGDAVTIERGRIYAVVFWSPGDPRSVVVLPRLSELQDAYKDRITFVAVATDAEGGTPEATEETAKAMGKGLGLATGWDDGGKTRAAWLGAAGAPGASCAFVVDGAGKIAFLGHPAILDLPLARIVAGKWDMAKGTEEMQAAFRRAQEILQMDRSMALAALPAFEKDYPELAWSEAIGTRNARTFASAKLRLLLLAGKTEEATALGTKLYEKGVKYDRDDLLNEIAWMIVDPEMSIAKRDLDLAMKAAEKAVELSKRNPSIVDTLARVYYWKGDLTKAIELQTEAVENAAGNEDELASLQPTLDQYKAEAAARK